jgi:cysteine desulfurase/selenocysteine lyase
MAERWRTELWPTLASGGWDDLTLGAHRFNHLGTFDESRMAGMIAGLAFLETIGFAVVHARIRELRRRVLDGLADMPGVRIVSPLDDELGAGMVSFTVDGLDGLELQRTLGAANVRTRVISEGERGWMRLSPHVWVLEEELDRVLALIGEAAPR